MNSKMLILSIGALVIIAASAFLLTKNSSTIAPIVPTPTTAIMMDEDTSDASPSTMMKKAEDSEEVAPSGAMMKEEAREIIVTGSNYKFNPATITVKKGETIKLVFKNSGGMHDFFIDELGVKTKVVPTNGEDTVQFTASKVGTFDYYCSVGTHRAMGMVGKITVQ